MITRFIFLVIFSSIVSAPAFSLRCGSDLVSKGNSQSRVLKKCGEPEAKYNRTIFRSRGVSVSDRENPRLRTSAFDDTSIEVHIDEWEYSFGPRRLGRRVIFENGRVVNIELLDYDN